ncbi:MAG: insulinase family protein [Paramuribaculum sp.]|nr:insulinase family protein [Paramuribaculum sp.]
MIETYRHTLGNGLRVVVHPDSNTVMVALDIIYNVGSRDERPDRTGMAHLFEHLMFGGSANVHDFDREVERAGGSNNAWTSTDFTNFYTVVPAVNAETAFWVESDRMLAPKLTGHPLEIQRQVVVEEFKQVCLNTPYGDLMHHLRPLVYTTHPYRWPTLGITPDHVAGATESDVTSFFNAHYSPGNAVLVVSGNIEPDKAFALAEHWFGDIPARATTPRNHPAEPPQTEARRTEVRDKVPNTLIQIAFPMAAYGRPGYVEADIITDILANGQASRLMRDVVAKGDVITRADTSITGSDEAGMLLVSAYLNDNSPAATERAERLIRQQLDRLIDTEVGADELGRCTARFASTIAFGQMSYLGCATELAQAEMQGEDINTRVDRYRSVTPAMVRTTAATLLRHECSNTVIYRPA